MDQRAAKIWWARDKKILREQRIRLQLTSVFSACIPSWLGLDNFLSLLGLKSIIPWVNFGLTDVARFYQRLWQFSLSHSLDIIDFPDVVSVGVTLLEADEAGGGGRGGGLLGAGDHAVPQLGAGGRGEVAGDGDAGGHVTHVTTAGLRTRVIGAQADQVAIRLLGEDWSEL